MTTAEQFDDEARAASTVSVAGVPWPVYKVVSLLAGLIVCGVVAVTTLSAAPAVLSGAAVATLAWLLLGLASTTGG